MPNLTFFNLIICSILCITEISYATPYNFTASVTETSLYYSGAENSPLPLEVGDTVTGHFDTTIRYDASTVDDLPWENRWNAYIDIYIDFGSFSASIPGGNAYITMLDGNSSDKLQLNDSGPLLSNFPNDFTIDEFWWTFHDTTGNAISNDTILPGKFDPYAFNVITFGLESVLPGDGWQGIANFKVNSINPIVPVPEPATMLLVVMGLSGIFFRKIRSE